MRQLKRKNKEKNTVPTVTNIYINNPSPESQWGKNIFWCSLSILIITFTVLICLGVYSGNLDYQEALEILTKVIVTTPSL